VRFLQQTARALLQIDDSPERTAFAFALGVFLGFSPLLGLHTVLGLAVAFLFRLNKIAVLVGVYTNTPWLLVPFYGFAAWLGLKMTGLSDAITLPHVGFLELFGAEFWKWLISQWWLLIPAFVGSSALCIFLALIAYPIALFTLRKFKGRPVVEPTSDT
jgi:uncharacterized protein (DUF2062 family)